MKCIKSDCPIFNACDQEKDQTYYCRKIELLVHLSKVSGHTVKTNFVKAGGNIH